MFWYSLSVLQLSALALGAICLLAVALRLQRAANDVVNVALLLPTGILLVLLGFFPGLASLPAEAVNLAQVRGGRILTLVVIGLIVVWFLLIDALRRLKRLTQDMQNLRLGLAVDDFLRSDATRQTNVRDVLVVMPALNEADNIAHVLARMPNQVEGQSVQTLVVNDGSTDGTESVSRENGVWVASHPVPYGGGMAVRTGYRIAERLGFKYLVTMDADGQHQPEELSRLIAPLVHKSAEFVIGSRQIGSGENYSTIRTIGVKLFSLAMTALMRKRITDCASGFRAFEVGALSRLRISAVQYHTAETIIAALKQGVRIVEVPITISRRHSGESKKGHDFWYGVNFMRSIVNAWWR